ncbi:glycoside hydrolase family 16 protein [Laccaria bicolor S238N-H82]|uniref:Glycoside hydrolase family 16 protein n=1 Tax=Laccaria bicolor (strain S238N-H82 / ATCC MYA-4686) TaxID=486041 RepID=B0DPL7_LACBS|nr:glycoside hydrolase family 16 protein [Laccaria bicolor S238N-H82]EDR03474.1 glycoside hydrolase family 16 protein [Laccaria bicolor S238N-H82]|eukprot:XP_001885930.1 glycoside hydrolase family 16 protein [Laccaria bicolor S238N-H82]
MAPVQQPIPVVPTTTTVAHPAWDSDQDLEDEFHRSEPFPDEGFDVLSCRGWINSVSILLLITGLMTLFVGYPILDHFQHLPPPIHGYNIGGINGTGQIPVLPGLPRMIDADTPSSALTRTGWDGKKYDLVFSDEFNVDGRTFYPGEDPYWEAVDLYYWPTNDVEWYDPSAITTKGGKLVITMKEVQNHNLNFMSGMLTSWNKLCFTTGYIEVSLSLPGSVTAPGFWPAAWTMGNLGRAAYGATTEGTWPYTYDSCDSGTFIGQTGKNGQPASSATGGATGGPISGLPGQRLSACSCPGSDHPGPKYDVGRGVPEVDIIEARIDTSRVVGQASQTFQVAPYNYQLQFVDTSPATTIYNQSMTQVNSFKGNSLQQSVSALADIGSQFYGGQAYAPYGYELWSDPNNRQDGYITWFSNGKPTWTVTSASVGPDPVSQVGQRLISEEPMYVVLNFGMSPDFQPQDYKHLVFPSQMFVDYVRIYQREGVNNGMTCDPPNRPTANYINQHSVPYNNPNLTTWASANFSFPRNSLYDGC